MPISRSRRAAPRPRVHARLLTGLLIAVASIGCPRGEDARAAAGQRTGAPPATHDTVDAPLVVYTAASLARPMRQALDAYAARTGVKGVLESGGSLEHARKLTELGRVPDLLVLADHEVFPRLLMPAHVDWYVRFARNRMVIAWTKRSGFARDMKEASWREILARPDVEVGRTDPATAPAGYRALLLLRLAALHYGDSTLERRILARAHARNMRANAAELVALLQTGQIDYILEYESLARAHGLQWLALPPQIDLSDPTREADYARASVRVPGSSPRDSVTIVGAPIVFGLSVPRAAPHRSQGEAFAAFLLSAEGRRILTQANVELIPIPRVIGRNVPDAMRSYPAP